MHLSTFAAVAALSTLTLAFPQSSYPSASASASESSSYTPTSSSSAAASPSRAPNQLSTDVVMGAESNDTADNAALITRLETAPTVVDRLALLNNGTDFVYDFNAPPAGATTSGNGGHTVKADRKVFPALVGTGVGMTVGFLGPCGFNTPHTHPRSSEINIVVEGELVAESIVENGAELRRSRLSKFQMTVFPQGAIHTEYNPLCEESVFVAGFASEDPGVQQTVQSFLGLDNDIITAAARTDFTFSGDQIDQFRSMIPKNIADGVDSCLQRCNITPQKVKA